MAVMDVGSGKTGTVDQASLAVRTDMNLHAVQKRIQKNATG